MVRQAAAEVLRKDQAPTGLAAYHRLAVPEVRQQILDGKLPVEVLMNEKVGEIKASIVEREGKILMVKDCPKHGHFEDVMSIDTTFSKHLEDVFPGRDIAALHDENM